MRKFILDTDWWTDCDDALPQKEMFLMAEQVTVFRKLAPGWFYVQLKY